MGVYVEAGIEPEHGIRTEQGRHLRPADPQTAAFETSPRCFDEGRPVPFQRPAVARKMGTAVPVSGHGSPRVRESQKIQGAQMRP